MANTVKCMVLILVHKIQPIYRLIDIKFNYSADKLHFIILNLPSGNYFVILTCETINYGCKKHYPILNILLRNGLYCFWYFKLYLIFCVSMSHIYSTDMQFYFYIKPRPKELVYNLRGCGRCGLAPTQLVATLRVTELVGAVSMLYCTLLHQGGPPKEEASLTPHAVAVTSATLRLLKAVAQLDLKMFQVIN